MSNAEGESPMKVTVLQRTGQQRNVLYAVKLEAHCLAMLQWHTLIVEHGKNKSQSEFSE